MSSTFLILLVAADHHPFLGWHTKPVWSCDILNKVPHLNPSLHKKMLVSFYKKISFTVTWVADNNPPYKLQCICFCSSSTVVSNPGCEQLLLLGPTAPSLQACSQTFMSQSCPSMPCSVPSNPSFQTPSPISQSNSEFKASSQVDMQLHPAWFRYWMNRGLIPSPTSLIANINSPVLFETN